MVAALLLLEVGIPVQQAIDSVRTARPNTIEPNQVDYLQRVARQEASSPERGAIE